ncbi:MAG TPA: DUF1326 domain-containing protein [Actinomycetota bacterium]|nr:DUF1326 domain-containing protein [Actinomycetota bacterium]
MEGRSSARLRGSPPGMGYLLEGSVLEAPPVARLRVTGIAGAGPVVAAWRIRRGRINGVDVSGQVVLVVSIRLPGAPDERIARLILLEERATPEQVLALVDAFRGKLGGPLADRSLPVAEEMGFSQVPITCRRDGRRGVVSVPHRFRLVFQLDPPGAAHATYFWINVPEHDLVRSGNHVAAAYREFRLVRAAPPRSKRSTKTRTRW